MLYASIHVFTYMDVMEMQEKVRRFWSLSILVRQLDKAQRPERSLVMFFLVSSACSCPVKGFQSLQVGTISCMSVASCAIKFNETLTGGKNKTPFCIDKMKEW